VGVQIKNTGTMAGEDVVQLYVDFSAVAKITGIERHPKLLRSFKKISLAPGEDAVVSFELFLDDLKRFDSVTERWVLDEGEYAIMVGPSSNPKTLLKEVVKVV